MTTPKTTRYQVKLTVAVEAPTSHTARGDEDPAQIVRRVLEAAGIDVALAMTSFSA